MWIDGLRVLDTAGMTVPSPVGADVVHIIHPLQIIGHLYSLNLYKISAVA